MHLGASQRAVDVPEAKTVITKLHAAGRMVGEWRNVVGFRKNPDDLREVGAAGIEGDIGADDTGRQSNEAIDPGEDLVQDRGNGADRPDAFFVVFGASRDLDGLVRHVIEAVRPGQPGQAVARDDEVETCAEKILRIAELAFSLNLAEGGANSQLDDLDAVLGHVDREIE